MPEFIIETTDLKLKVNADSEIEAWDKLDTLARLTKTEPIPLYVSEKLSAIGITSLSLNFSITKNFIISEIE